MVLQGQDLSEEQASDLMNSWLNEELSPVQTGAFLAALRAKGVTGDELAAMAKVLQGACSLPCALPDLSLADTCGTGGDGADTFNISTAVAFTAASCGVHVAKHGNRSASGKVGSADVLEGLGFNLKAPLKVAVDAVQQTGVTFLFAPAWHQSLVGLAPLRKNLGVRTVFNLLGPLVNPLKPKYQVLGVANFDLLEPMANALKKLGLKRAVVVHGAGGLDEASLAGPNFLKLIENGSIKESVLDPKNLGLPSASLDDLKGGDLETNKSILSAVLQGKGTIAQQNVVAINTALVLWVANLNDDFKSGLEEANNALSSGLPWERFNQLRNEFNS